MEEMLFDEDLKTPTRITKEDLISIKKIGLALENCDDYDFDGSDIVDIYFDKIVCNEEGGKTAQIGRLVIAPSAFTKTGTFYEYFGKEEDISKERFHFLPRILSVNDVCYVSISFKDGRSCCYAVEYDPLDGFSSHVYVMGYSNCMSSSIDENGNLQLLFGELSKTPRRIDDDYKNAILNYSNVLENDDEVLEVKVKHIEYEMDTRPLRNATVTFAILNKCRRKKSITLTFEDIEHFSFSSQSMKEASELHISSFSTNEFCVMVMDGMAFWCKRIYEGKGGLFDEWFDSAVEYNDKDTYKRAIRCQLSEEEMRRFCANRFGHRENDLEIEWFENALQLVEDGRISMCYFVLWLDYYSSVLRMSFDGGEKNFDVVHNISILMYKLSLILSYKHSYQEAKDVIEEYKTKIMKFYEGYEK